MLRFWNCIQFVGQRYGYENVVGGYVHKDETTPHIHIPFVPVQHDKERDVDRLIAKEVVNRQDLRTFHKDLERFLEREKTPAHILNGATKDLKEQLREKEHELEFYQREFSLDREQQTRLNHYLEQQREIDKQMDRNDLEQDRDNRDRDRDRWGQKSIAFCPTHPISIKRQGLPNSLGAMLFFLHSYLKFLHSYLKFLHSYLKNQPKDFLEITR